MQWALDFHDEIGGDDVVVGDDNDDLKKCKIF